MDDTLLRTEEPPDEQYMLNITTNLSGRYHIGFVEVKGKALIKWSIRIRIRIRNLFI